MGDFISFRIILKAKRNTETRANKQTRGIWIGLLRKCSLKLRCQDLKYRATIIWSQICISCIFANLIF